MTANTKTSLFGLALALVACAGEEESGQTVPPPAPPDPSCAVDETQLDDDTCVAPGVTAEDCAEGFVLGNRGCDPVLPAEPCAHGTFALPGETSCAPVSACATGRWVDPPPGLAVVRVDAAATGPADGSEAAPYSTISAALSAAPVGAAILVAAGEYTESVQVSRTFQIIGVCPEATRVTPAAGAPAFIVGRQGGATTGVVLRGLAAVGGGYGIFVTNSEAEFEEMWVADTEFEGIVVTDEYGPASLTMRRFLVENAGGSGVVGSGSEVHLEQGALRNTTSTQPAIGRGLSLLRSPNTDVSSLATAKRVVLEGNATNLAVGGSELEMEEAVLRDPVPADRIFTGFGVHVTADLQEPVSAVFTLRRSTVQRSAEAGLLIQSGLVLLEGVTVQDTQAHPVTGYASGAIQAQPLFENPAPPPVSLEMIRCTLAGNVGFGVQGHAAPVRLEDVLVTDTLPDPLGLFGRALNLQHYSDEPGVFLSAQGEVLRSRFVRSHETGVAVISSHLDMHASSVRGVLPKQLDGLLGDGVAMASYPAPAPLATADLDRVRVEHAVRAGVFVYAASASLARGEMSCNAMDLVTHSSNSIDATLTDGGDNVCGCDGTTEACVAQVSEIEPPTAY